MFVCLFVFIGIASPALGFGLTFAISFSSYSFACDNIKKYNFNNNNINYSSNNPARSKDDQELTLTEMMAAGAFTGFVQSPARQLMERVKSVMQIWESDTKGTAPMSLISEPSFNHTRTMTIDRSTLQARASSGESSSAPPILCERRDSSGVLDAALRLCYCARCPSSRFTTPHTTSPKVLWRGTSPTSRCANSSQVGLRARFNGCLRSFLPMF